MMAILMLAFMLVSMIVPIAQQAGLVDTNPIFATAMAAPDDTTVGGGALDGITIDSSGKVTFSGTASTTDADSVLGQGKNIITLILSACCLICLAFLIINITKFAKSGDNDMERRKAIGGMLTTGIGVALLGSITVWYAFFYSALVV